MSFLCLKVIDIFLTFCPRVEGKAGVCYPKAIYFRSLTIWEYPLLLWVPPSTLPFFYWIMDYVYQKIFLEILVERERGGHAFIIPTLPEHFW